MRHWQEISDETIAEAQLAATVAEENDLKRPKLLWINALLAIAVIGFLCGVLFQQVLRL